MPALPTMGGGGGGGAPDGSRGQYARAFEEKTRKLAQAAQASTDKAHSLEATVASLTDRLLESESSVKMLRTQLRRMQQQQADDPAKARSAKNLHAGLPSSKPNARMAGASAASAPPLRLPKLGGGEAGGAGPPTRLGKGARDEAQREEDRQLRALHRVREEGFVTAFPDYGGKTRSGLRGIGQTRLEESRQERERKRKEERREKHLRALSEHGLSPSKRHERVLAEEAAAVAIGVGRGEHG